MTKALRRAWLVPLAASLVLGFGSTATAAQTVVVTPTKPPATEKPSTDSPARAQPPAEAAKPTPQTPPAQGAKPSPPPAPPAPPDRTAFLAAQKMPDGEEKIAALEKWLKDFPDSGGRATTLGLLFDTLVKVRPADQTAITGTAQKIIDAGQEGFRASGYSRVAGSLLNAGIFLDEAARYAEDGLKVFEEDENKRIQQSRATHLATLGRIRIKQGRVAEGEKALKAAYAANPEVPNALIGLAEIAESRKDAKAALDYWLRAAITGRLSKENRLKFETAFKAANNGSIDGLDAAMDAKYKATMKNPVHATAYKATPSRSNRIVLAEVFTGAGCPPCVAADLAFDAAMERYSRKELAVVMYHLHIPVPDPLTNKSTVERAKYYTVNGVPTAAVEGVPTVGGGARSATKGVYDRIVAGIDKALEVPADATLSLDASLVNGVVKVKASPAALAAEGDAVKLQILLVEEMLSYSGENGVRFHPMVVRSIGGENYGGFTVDRNAPAAIDHVFDLGQIDDETRQYIDEYEKTRAGTQPGFAFSRKPVQMNGGNLSIVAFLQDEKSKKVLQTAYVRLRSPSTSTANR